MFISVSDAAKKWKISDRMVRRYCIQGRIQGAYQEDEVWFVPEDAEKPERKVPDIQENPTPKPQPPLVKKLRQQKTKKMFHGLYDYVQTRSPAPTAARPAAVSCSLRSRRSLRRTRSRPASSPSRWTISSRPPTICSAWITSLIPPPRR